MVGAFVAALEQAGEPRSELVVLMSDSTTPDSLRPVCWGGIPLIGEPAEFLFGRSLYQDAYLRSFLGDHLAALGVRTFADLTLDPGGPLGAEVAVWRPPSATA